MNGLRLLPLLLSLALAACGGGGGGDSGGNSTSGGSGGSGGGGDGSTGGAGTPGTPYAVGGTIAGLLAPGLVLQLNEGAELPVDAAASFRFAEPVPANTSYAVTVLVNPAGQTCTVGANGAGIMPDAELTDVGITCTTPAASNGPYAVSGTVTGLTAAGLTLDNGTEQISVPANATQFTFPTPLAKGTYYGTTVVAQPAGLTCALLNGAGTAYTPVTNLSVRCRPALTQAGFSVDKSSLSFVAEQGAPLPAQLVTGSVVGATGTVYVSILATSTGIASAIYTPLAGNTGQLVVTPKDSLRAPGTYNDSITAMACYDPGCSQPLPGSPVTLPVTTTITAPPPPATLLVSEYAVAFTAAPGQSRLSHVLTVGAPAPLSALWTATSDQTWLTVTASGFTGSGLSLTADPTGLADGFHEAVVTVTPGNVALGTRQVRVGLYVSATAAATAFATKPVMYSYKYWLPPLNWVVDPLRPLAYNANGNAIAIDHTYTGARVTTMPVAGATYASIAVSDDGSWLYALNDASRTLDVFNLDTRTRTGSFALPNFPFSSSLTDIRLAFARVQGKPVVVLGSIDMGPRRVMPILDAGSGQQIGVTGHNNSPDLELFVASRNGRVLYLADAGLSGMLSVSRVTLYRNSLGNVYGLADGATTAHNVAALQDLATSADGSQLYVSWGSQSGIHKATIHHFQYDNGTLPESALFSSTAGYCSSLEVDVADHLACLKGGSLFWLLDSAGTLLREAAEADVGATFLATPQGALRVSSDGLRLLGNGVITGN